MSKTYGRGGTAVVALDGISVVIPRGRLTAIMGASGSGKSTLMHCLAGLDTVTSGQVRIGGVELTKLGDRDLTRLRRDRIGFVFQSFNLVPTLTVLENMILPLELAGRKPDRHWLTEIIDAVDMGDRLKHRPGELSGGQQQRVACARALAGRPEIVFADEPTGNLDSRSGTAVLELLRRCVDLLGQTIVMVTHDPRAAAYADQVLFLADGKIMAELQQPTPDAILEHLTRAVAC
ncbi:ABC transporter ATP-binding protein [Dactylosporangium sp. CA-233914]|uniref:ABC transporter ATP-binding protein n=1 Tax=Dactylosporangium sp. CA-233914 TaxID=3239934 RepID=UPI003D92B29C